jgi:hypothetical protein
VKTAKRPKPARGEAFGILNPYGDIWTHETFRTEARAKAYVAAFWAGLRTTVNLEDFKVIPVKVTVSAK